MQLPQCINRNNIQMPVLQVLEIDTKTGSLVSSIHKIKHGVKILNLSQGIKRGFLQMPAKFTKGLQLPIFDGHS